MKKKGLKCIEIYKNFDINTSWLAFRYLAQESYNKATTKKKVIETQWTLYRNRFATHFHKMEAAVRQIGYIFPLEGE